MINHFKNYFRELFGGEYIQSPPSSEKYKRFVCDLAKNSNDPRVRRRYKFLAMAFEKEIPNKNQKQQQSWETIFSSGFTP